MRVKGLVVWCALAIAIVPMVLGAPMARAGGSLPTGEMQVGQSTVEPAYNDVNGNLVYLLTPNQAPFPVVSNPIASAPIYIVVYPGASGVGTLNCMGLPGNCPDHDGEIAGAATTIMPGVYGPDPRGVLGHDHLLAPPASGGDFNIAWHVWIVLFTNADAAKQHLTTLDGVTAALTAGNAIKVDAGFAFMCAVVPAVVYNHGTPVSG